jgi:hypothetical protein
LKKFNAIDWLFLCSRIFAIVLGFYHINLFFFSVNGNGAAHLLFVAICVISAFGFWKRPKWFVYFFLLLVLWQLYIQGVYLYSRWQTVHLFDIKSFAIIILMPIIFMALQKDKKHASKAS